MKAIFILLSCLLCNTRLAGQESRKYQEDDTVKIRQLTVAQFKERTSVKDMLVLVNFSADWCIVCKKQKPILDEIAAENKEDVIVLELDMEDNPLIAEHFEVSGLPVSLIYRKGLLVWNRIGFQRKTELMDALWKYRIETNKK